MHFDKIIMNQPYCRNLHLKILRETMKYSNDIIALSPIRWLQDPLAEYKKNSDFKKFEDIRKRIKDLEVVPASYAEKLFNIGLPFNLGIYHITEKGSWKNEFRSQLLDKMVKKCLESSLKDHIIVDDLDGIRDLAYDVIDTYREVHGGKLSRKFSVTVSTSTFVPKPFTPFQWHPQDTQDVVREKQQYLVKALKNRDIRYNYHDSKTSLMEAVISRGDRRIGKVIYDAFKAGAKFDGWSEYFNLDIWTEAMEKNNLDISWYAHRERSYDEVFAWDHIDVGVTKKFLIRENNKAKEDAITPDCRHRCNGCGINSTDLGRGLC